MGRFLQEDTYRGDGLNLYAYCANNPVGYFDPSGYKKQNTICTESTENDAVQTAGSEINNEKNRVEDLSRTKWGAEHGKGNVRHNNAIESELDQAYSKGALDLRKNKVQRDANGNRVYSSDGKYTRPDASYILGDIRYNTNYISNDRLVNIDELNRELEAFQRMIDADPNAINSLVFKY